MGRRSWLATRTRAQVGWQAGSPGVKAACSCCAVAGSNWASLPRLWAWALAWSAAETGRALTSRSKVEPMTQKAPSGPGTCGTKLPLPFTGKGGRAAALSAGPTVTCPRRACKRQSAGKKALLPMPAATMAMLAPAASGWPCASLACHWPPSWRSWATGAWPIKRMRGCLSCAATKAAGRNQPARWCHTARASGGRPAATH